MGMKEANGFDNDGNPIQYGLSGGNVTTNAKGMKPSQRIYQIIGETRSDPEWQERAIEAIIQFLDQQHEGKGKMSGEKLAPCPFCGGKAIAEEHYVETRESYRYVVRCKRCFSQVLHHENIGDAINFWNARTPPSFQPNGYDNDGNPIQYGYAPPSGGESNGNGFTIKEGK